MIALRRPSRLELALLAVLLGTFVAAPTPGDIGGCGQSAQQLDAPTFFASKAYIDCDRCGACGFLTKPCKDACAANASIPRAFPDGCVPLVHDGEVCLRALNNASCSDYADYVTDNASTRSTPTECEFCPAR